VGDCFPRSSSNGSPSIFAPESSAKLDTVAGEIPSALSAAGSDPLGRVVAMSDTGPVGCSDRRSDLSDRSFLVAQRLPTSSAHPSELRPDNAPLGNWPALRAAGPKSARGRRRDTVEILYASINPHLLERRLGATSDTGLRCRLRARRPAPALKLCTFNPTLPVFQKFALRVTHPKIIQCSEVQVRVPPCRPLGDCASGPVLSG
jgi:hypothetical protein